MVLAKDEVVVKEWQYATAKQGMEETKETLTVTNKRIVSTMRSSLKVEQQEIFVKDVKRISASHETPSKIPAFIMIGLGVIIAIMAFVLMGKLGEMGTMALVLLVPAALLVVAGILMLGKGAFTLTITLEGFESAGISTGAINFLKKYAKAKIKVAVNNAVAEEIIDTIGAIIAENK